MIAYLMLLVLNIITYKLLSIANKNTIMWVALIITAVSQFWLLPGVIVGMIVGYGRN